MLESITLGDIAIAVAFLVALIGGFSALIKHLKNWIKAAMKDEIDPLKESIKAITKELKVVDMEATKNFLVRFLADVEKGKEIDSIELQRFWEQYDHYRKNDGNSYIKEKVEELKHKGYL